MHMESPYFMHRCYFVWTGRNPRGIYESLWKLQLESISWNRKVVYCAYSGLFSQEKTYKMALTVTPNSKKKTIL